MALSDVQIAGAIKSTLGHIGKGHGDIQVLKVRDAVAKKLGVTDPRELLQILSHVQQARRISTAGDEMTDDTNNKPHARNLPLDRSGDPARGKYIYRVIITVFDPSTLSAHDTQEIVYSNDRLGADSIKAAAFAQFERHRYDISTDPKRDQVSASASISGRIISAGRTS